MKAGQEARIDFEYERCGVANIFLASKPLKGKRIAEVTERKTKTVGRGSSDKLPMTGTHQPGK